MIFTISDLPNFIILDYGKSLINCASNASCVVVPFVNVQFSSNREWVLVIHQDVSVLQLLLAIVFEYGAVENWTVPVISVGPVTGPRCERNQACLILVELHQSLVLMDATSFIDFASIEGH